MEHGGEDLEGERTLPGLERPQLGPANRLPVCRAVPASPVDSLQRRRSQSRRKRRHDAPGVVVAVAGHVQALGTDSGRFDWVS